jgi:hypothetical protein
LSSVSPASFCIAFMQLNSMIGCLQIPIPSAGKPTRIGMELKSMSTANSVVGVPIGSP